MCNLVQVLRKDNPSRNFNELRYWMYHHVKTLAIAQLLPTTASIRFHILRAFFITYGQNRCLKREVTSLNPLLFGYKKQNGYLIPKSVTTIFSSTEELVPNCNCAKCSRQNNCCCRTAGLSCCSFCHCRTTAQCNNPYDVN